MKKNRKGLLSNCAFLMKFAYKTNRSIFFLKMPQMVLNTVAPFIPIVFMRLILNEITIGQDIRKLFLYVMLLAVASFAKDFLGSVLNCFVASQTEMTVRKIKIHLGEIVAEMPYSDVEQPQIRDFIERAQDGTNFTRVFDRISDIVTATITIIGLAAIIVTIQPIIFVLVAVVVLFRLVYDKKSRSLWEKWRPSIVRNLRRGNYYLGVMRGIEFGKEVRLNGIQDWIYKRTDVSTDEYLDTSKRYNLALQRARILSVVVGIVQECSVYLILAYRVVFTGMSIGDFSMYMTSISTFSNSVSAIVSSISSFMETGLFVRDFRYCIEIAEKTKGGSGKSLLEMNHSDIVLQIDNVSFKYPNTDRYVLKNVSLSLKAGESTSIVGMNGVGKTTLIKLICRFYEPTEGKILLNGTDIQTYSYQDYVGLIGAVFQDFKLFSFSVSENVSFSGVPDSERVYDCLQKSGLEQKIKNLPYGLDTNISKEFDSQGIEFSGGEGQKLAMARTLYKNSPIMILDEPTSALDPIAEAEIYRKFHEITEKKIAIFISHRLSSCRFCNKIVVLDGGTIVQCGSHDELMAEGGLYFDMWNMQAQYYTEIQKR